MTVPVVAGCPRGKSNGKWEKEDVSVNSDGYLFGQRVSVSRVHHTPGLGL